MEFNSGFKGLNKSLTGRSKHVSGQWSHYGPRQDQSLPQVLRHGAVVSGQGLGFEPRTGYPRMSPYSGGQERGGTYCDWPIASLHPRTSGPFLPLGTICVLHPRERKCDSERLAN